MKKLLIIPAMAALLGIFAFKKISDPLPIGASLPKASVEMMDVSGEMVTLKKAMKENGLLVMFSCNTCPYVIKNQSRTNEISKHALESNVGVVLLNPNEGSRGKADSFDAMKKYAKANGYAWYYAVDKDHVLADAFGADRTPECFLFDKNGKLVYHGAIDDNPGNADAVKNKHLQTAIDKMINGEEITNKTSRSVGCAIKRVN